MTLKNLNLNLNTGCGEEGSQKYLLFLNSSSPETQEGKTPSPSISRHASFETDQVSKDFMDFLKNLQKPGRDIHKQCRAFILTMSSKKV